MARGSQHLMGMEILFQVMKIFQERLVMVTQRRE